MWLDRLAYAAEPMGKKGTAGDQGTKSTKGKTEEVRKPALKDKPLTMKKGQEPRVKFTGKVEVMPETKVNTNPKKTSAAAGALKRGKSQLDLSKPGNVAKKAKAAKETGSVKQNGGEAKIAKKPSTTTTSKSKSVSKGTKSTAAAPTTTTLAVKDGFVTPPAKRMHGKTSPAPSVTSSASSMRRTAAQLAEARQRAQQHLMEREDLEQAAREAETTALMDAGGLAGYLDYIKDNGAHPGDGSQALMLKERSAADLKKKGEDETEGGEEEAEEGKADEEEQEQDEEQDEDMDEEQDEEDEEHCEEQEEQEEEQEEEEDEEQQEEPEEEENEEHEEEQEEEQDDEEDEEMPELEPLEEAAEEDQKGGPENPGGDQLANAVQDTREQTQRRNSTTNKKEWDKFARECVNKKAFPASLTAAYKKNKVDLFNVWLDMGMSWEKNGYSGGKIPRDQKLGSQPNGSKTGQRASRHSW